VEIALRAEVLVWPAARISVARSTLSGGYLLAQKWIFGRKNRISGMRPIAGICEWLVLSIECFVQKNGDAQEERYRSFESDSTETANPTYFFTSVTPI